MSISNFAFFSITATAADEPISISSIYIPSSIQAGSKAVEATVTVKNNTSSKINGVNAVIDDANGAIEVTTSRMQTKDIDGNSSETFSFYFNVGSTAGVITFNVEYNGYVINETRGITITIPTPPIPEPQSPFFEVTNEVHPKSVNIGENMRIAFRFANKGNSATGVIVEITPTPAEGIKPFLTTSSSNTIIYVGSMLPNQAYNCYWDFNITDEAKPGLHTFTVTVRANSGNTVSYPMGIMIEKSTIENNKNVPDVKIVYTKLPDSIKIDEEFTIKAVLENTGADAKNIKVTITLPDGIKNYSPLEITIDSLNQGEQKEVEFKVIATDSADLKYNSISLNVKYNKTAETVKEDVYSIGLLVLGKDSAVSNLTINATLPGTVKANEDFKVNFTVTNKGPDEKNLYVKIVPPTGFISNALGNIHIGDLKSSESKTYEAVFSATDEAAGKSGFFKVSLHGNADILLAEQTIRISVSNPDLPKIIIDSVSFPQNVSIGETFNVDVTVMNTGAAKADNVKIAVTNNNGILNATNNSVIIDSLKSGGKQTVTVTFKVDKSAKYGYTPFTAEVSYGSESINQYFGVTVNSSDLKIESVKLPSSVGINRDFNVEVAVKNTGADTTDVLISLSPESGIINKSSNTVKIDSIKSGQTVVKSFTFMATESAPDRYVSININLSHESESITQYSGLIINNPPKKEEDKKPEDKNDIPVVIINWFNFTNVESNPPPGNSNNDNFNNNGGVDFGMPEGIMPRDEKTADKEAEIFNKTSVISVMPAPVAPAPAPGNSFSPGYSGDNNFDVSQNNGNTPVNDTNAVYGGQSFIFTIELKNMHNSIAVKDLKITISQDKGIFNPKSGSNTFFVEWLAPGQSVEQNIELLVKSDAIPDSYGITISLSYKSEKGESTSSSEIINIPVQQELRFSIGDLPPINDIEMGDEAYVNVQFGNLGKSWIYNVVVRAQGDGFMNPEGTYYAGNIEAGKFIGKEFTLVPFNPGFMNGSFLFTYEDADGNTYNEQLPFFFNVMGDIEMPTWDDGGDVIYGPDGLPVINPNGEEESDKTDGFWLFTNMNLLKWAIIIGGGLFIIAAVVVIIVVIVKVRRKKAKDDDDDDY
jgi:hypothetical protein